MSQSLRGAKHLDDAIRSVRGLEAIFTQLLLYLLLPEHVKE